MDLKYQQKKRIASVYIDSSVKLGIPHAALMLQDNLTECFEEFGCDGVTYKRKYNAFWVITKTKIHFEGRPDWMEDVEVESFPIEGGGLRTHVNSVMRDKDGKTLLVANQELCVLDFERHRPVRLNDVGFPQEGFPTAAVENDFEKFAVEWKEDDLVYIELARYQHLDMSHHVNNTEYIKLALNVFTEEYLLAHEPKDVEMHYTGESMEGQLLQVYHVEQEGAHYVQIVVEGRRVFEMKMTFK